MDLPPGQVQPRGPPGGNPISTDLRRPRRGRAHEALPPPPAVMGAFLAGIGTKLADRWVNALLLPGLLWTALLAAGVHLGQAHAFAADHLSEWLEQLAARP